MKKFLVIFFSLILTTGCAVVLPQNNSSVNQTGQADSTSPAVASAEAGAYQYAKPWDKEMFDGFYKQAKDVPSVGAVKGGIVPHHLLAGNIPATFFNYLSAQKPSLVVLLGPNHQNSGQTALISSLSDWQTPYGTLTTDKALVENLLKEGLVGVDEGVMRDEHSIGSLVSFVKKSLPETKILPIILKFKTPTSTLDSLIENLKKNLPADAMIVSSVDFSHYMTAPVANFHDELSQAAVIDFDYARLNRIDVDSPSSLYVLLKLMENSGAERVAYKISDNAAYVLGRPDIPETTSYFSAYFTTGDKTPQRMASLLFFGDMMLERNVKNAFDKNNGPDYLFSKLAGQENRFFLGMDAVHANLEGPFANSRRQTSKEIAFRFDPALITTLKKYNFSIFSAANNHSYDMGADGFNESNRNIGSAGLDVYGAQYRTDEDGSVLIKSIGDFKVSFIGLNDTNEPLNEEKIIELVKKAKAKSDFSVVNIHWGQEYQEISNSHQREIARALIDAGADAIIGHHPHVVQEMEIYKNRPIFYSLGNFIFDQYFSTSTQQGLSVGLVFSSPPARGGEGVVGENISVYVFPLQGSRSQVSQMPYAEKENYFSGWLAKSRLGDYKFENYNVKISL